MASRTSQRVRTAALALVLALLGSVVLATPAHADGEDGVSPDPVDAETGSTEVTVGEDGAVTTTITQQTGTSSVPEGSTPVGGDTCPPQQAIWIEGVCQWFLPCWHSPGLSDWRAVMEDVERQGLMDRMVAAAHIGNRGIALEFPTEGDDFGVPEAGLPVPIAPQVGGVTQTAERFIWCTYMPAGATPGVDMETWPLHPEYFMIVWSPPPGRPSSATSTLVDISAADPGWLQTAPVPAHATRAVNERYTWAKVPTRFWSPNFSGDGGRADLGLITVWSKRVPKSFTIRTDGNTINCPVGETTSAINIAVGGFPALSASPCHYVWPTAKRHSLIAEFTYEVYSFVEASSPGEEKPTDPPSEGDGREPVRNPIPPELRTAPQPPPGSTGSTGGGGGGWVYEGDYTIPVTVTMVVSSLVALNTVPGGPR